MSSQAETPAISIAGVTRVFGDVVALDNINLEIRRGEVLAVLGENGAGKTTLMRIIGGLDTPTSGAVLRHGEPFHPQSPGEAVSAGIALVHQHFALVPTMTPAEIILLFRAQRDRRCSRKEAAAQLKALADDLGFAIELDGPIGERSVGEQQRLELLRALDADPEVLLLDEPTAVLTDEEATALLDVVRKLAHEQNRAVVLITHRLREVVAAADRVVVLRAGEVVSPASPVGDHTPESLAAEMVGSDVPAVARQEVAPGAEVLTVTDLYAGQLKAAILHVHENEILGVAGVDGNGQVELELALAGLLKADFGSATLGGTNLLGLHPRARIAAGFAYLPSDRYARALVGPMRCDENLLIGRTPWRLDSAVIDATKVMAQWAVKGAPHHTAASLSGGNAQKLVAAREFEENTKLVLACQPTRGLDPGAANQLKQRLLDFSGEGGAVVWISADLDELLETADRLVVVSDGRVFGPFARPFDRAQIGLIMAGGV